MVISADSHSNQSAGLQVHSPPLIAHNMMCIFFHDTTLPIYCRRNLESNFKNIFYCIPNFSDVEHFTTFIDDDFLVKKLVFIISGKQAKALCALVERRRKPPQKPFVYELQFGNCTPKSNLTRDRKFQSIGELYRTVVREIETYNECSNQNQTEADSSNDDNERFYQESTFLFGIQKRIRPENPFSYLNRDSLKFNLFQTFIKVLLKTDINNQDIRDMWTYCRRDQNYQNDIRKLEEIRTFERDYAARNAIRFYTRDAFLFRKVNKALRCENAEEIFAFRPFFKHLHTRLNELDQEQRSYGRNISSKVHRGKKLPISVLQQLRSNVRNLISINGLVSATTSDSVAKIFAGGEGPRENYESVVFEMHTSEASIDENINVDRPFAYIANESDIPDEDEVLFFMGRVWSIVSIEPPSIENHWKVILKLSTDLDSQIISQYNRFTSDCTYFTLGKILHELGEYKNALWFYFLMLKISQTAPPETRADIYFHMAQSNFADQSYQTAFDNLQQAEQILKEAKIQNRKSPGLQPKYAEDVDLSLMRIITNMGLAHQTMQNYDAARLSFERALTTTDGSTEDDRANLYYCIGVLNFEEGQYDEARDSYSNALTTVRDDTLRDEINNRLSTVNKLLHG